MAQAISIGAQSFEFIREKNCFFVDKTGLIREWWENADAVTLIARGIPRERIRHYGFAFAGKQVLIG